MLKIEGVNSFYGKVHVLYDINLHVDNDEIISIIGANGAGKTTLMKTIMGVVHAGSGSIHFEGQAIERMPTHRIVAAGISYVPEGREVFSEATVLENLKMGAYTKRLSQGEMNARLDEMYEMFPRLKERTKQKAGSLSGGEQQMLAIARGLMNEPKLIMFDEPSLGLAPVIVDEVFEVIQNVNSKKHIPILLVEQNAYMALTISSRCYVLETGHIVQEGLSSELINSDTIHETYLGG